MSRFIPNFAAALAAIVITFSSIHAITMGPDAPVAMAGIQSAPTIS